MVTNEELTRLADRVRGDERLDAPLRIVGSEPLVELAHGDVRVLLVHGDDPELLEKLSPHLGRLSGQLAAVLFVGGPSASIVRALPKRIVAGSVRDAPTDDELYLAVDGAVQRLLLAQGNARLEAALDRTRYEVRELTSIARAITQERDIDRLLDLILAKSRFVTGADAGSIYVVEAAEGDPRTRRLRFKMSQNDSCQFESREFTIPISTRSIAGYAAATKRPVDIADVHVLPADAPYSYDPSFDRRVGYSTRSMIAVPMISAEDEVIGVIQLINKKKNPRAVLRTEDDYDLQVIPFDARSSELLLSLASQAGIALENALLYDEIRKIFEGFVRASVQAIEQRDPTTSGHSLRVSVLSCRLAQTVDRADSGPYAGVRFTPREVKELEYAALLHDFGKIGVREQVLVKAKKLYPHALEAIRARIHYAGKVAEADALAQKIALMERGAAKSDLDRIDDALRARREQLAEVYRLVSEANEPTVLSEGDFTRIHEIAKLPFTDADGNTSALLSSEEVIALSVRRGSLTDREMDEIRSHVVHTYEFLSRIPWGKSYARVAEIAGAHHEKLDGTGYPHGKRAHEIPLQSKIMTIADIYDALTARDRPYKKAMPADRALGILDLEVKSGHVDDALVRIFREAEIYREVERNLEY